MATIFDAISPILLATKPIGLAPFQVNVKKKLFNVSIIGLVYTGLMLILYAANAGYYTYIAVIKREIISGSYMGTAKDLILLPCDVAVTICTILFTIVQRNKYVKVVHNFYNVGFEMDKINEHVSYKNLIKYSRLHSVLILLAMTSLFFQFLFRIDFAHKLVLFCTIYTKFVPKVYNFLMELQFVSATLLLKIHYNALNKSLGKFNDFQENTCNKEPLKVLDIGINENAWLDNLELKKNNKVIAQTFAIWEGNLSKFRTRKVWTTDKPIDCIPIFLEKIKTIRKIHSSLCDIKEHLNSAFSLQLLTSVAQSFVAITADLYMIFTTLSSPTQHSVVDLAYFITWSCVHTLELVIVVVSCTLTSKTANYTAVLVHKLLAKDCPSELRNQLKLFSIQLLHRKISFTASGFFTLDMTLLQAVMGAATTYLVILIQFHNSYENVN